MRKKRLPGTAEIIDRIRHNPTKGAVYWFLRRELPPILENSVSGRISLVTLLADIQRLGLTNGLGKPIDNVRTLESTIATVKRDIAREAEAKRLKEAGPPKRPTNTPPPVVHPVQVRPWVPQTNAPSSPPDDGDDDPLWTQIKKRSAWRG